MSITSNESPGHMGHIYSIFTSVDGISYSVQFDYFPAFDDFDGKYPHGANVVSVLLCGYELSQHLKESVLEIFVERFLREMNEANYGD